MHKRTKKNKNKEEKRKNVHFIPVSNGPRKCALLSFFFFFNFFFSGIQLFSPLSIYGNLKRHFLILLRSSCSLSFIYLTLLSFDFHFTSWCLKSQRIEQNNIKNIPFMQCAPHLKKKKTHTATTIITSSGRHKRYFYEGS